MRITGGTLRGRPLKAPEGQATRPTSDRAREALFNILAHHEWGADIGDPLEDARILDAFCGTGALAFEALSRGGTQAFLFDKARTALRLAAANAASLGVKKMCLLFPADATKPPQAAAPCTLIFLDPPYRKNLAPAALKALDEAGWIAPHALIVVETAKNETLDLPERFVLQLSRTYGDTAVHFVLASFEQLF
ncbi:MAG: 16S rRNA (guanine(966)-N(2))-methyltransferase RsmD [Alphaproteobacteria bacterium]|nr:16S rRNA (guanine(966)-N(2))-methyltransferase RsmD [Alphaproteobacteria bacterium]